MRVREFMNATTAVVLPNASLQIAAALMKTHEIGFLPVVEVERGVEHLRGIVTDRDLFIAVLTGEPPRKPLTVKDVMRTDLVTCRDSDQIETALQLMEQNHVRRLPVLGEKGNLVGVISVTDIARARILNAEQMATAVQRILPEHRPRPVAA